MDEKKQTKKNMWFYPLGTVGRDAIYQFFTNFVLTFITFTKGLNAAQISVIGVIMVAARIFDAFNDPIMGFIIEKTHTRWGKFKPWLAIGMLSTAVVIICIFTLPITGWAYVALFGVFYFLYSITYTMHDISYWGMVPALSRDGDTRNALTSRAVLFAGIGGTLVGLVVPMLTAGSMTIGGSTSAAYAILSVVISVVALGFICFTIFGVKETNVSVAPKNAKRTTVKDMIKTIFHNKPLLWVVVAFILQQIGNGLIAGGIGSTYIYFEFGYSGGLYSTFSTVGLAATAILMVFYPMIAKKMHRKSMMNMMMIIGAVGYAVMLLGHFLIPGGTGFNAKFVVVMIGYTLSNFGQYGFYLIMMISILNTVEYNEYISGERNEAVITSVRPLLTKLGSAIIAGVTSLSYVIFSVTDITSSINTIDSSIIPSEAKDVRIANLIDSINSGTTTGLLLLMVLVPAVLMTLSFVVYQLKYKLDEKEFDRIVAELDKKRAAIKKKNAAK